MEGQYQNVLWLMRMEKLGMQFCVPKHNFDMQNLELTLTFQMFMLRGTQTMIYANKRRFQIQSIGPIKQVI